jgi:hypothetical protein
LGSESLLLSLATMFAASAAMLVAARTVVRSRPVRRSAQEIAAQFTGEVVARRKLAAVFDPSYSYGLTIRRHDGKTITVTVPMALGHQFPLGCRIVKYSGERWPVRAGAPPRNPGSDRVVSPCYRTSGGLAVHVRPACCCSVRGR